MNNMNKFESYSRFLTWFMALLLVALAAGCGGGGGDQGRDPILGTPPLSVGLVSVAVTPATASIPIGAPQQFIATATYTDGTSRDVTASSSWTSGTAGVATVNSTSGAAAGVAAGTSVITASFGGMTGSATLTVNAATLSSIAVTPAAVLVPIGGTQRFVATGTFSDGTSADISNTVTWTSNNAAVATVVSPGVATGLTTGIATITATSGARAGSATLTVPAPLGPPPVLLGTAGNFAILTKAGITDVPTSAIAGNIGTSPITGAAIGVTCVEVVGLIYSVDAAGPACEVVDPVLLGTAVGDMQIAYTDAAGRPAGVGPNLNLGAGTVAGQTLVPGTYTWSSNVTITTDLTLNGGPNDVWIFQITGTLNISPNMRVVLTGGALPKNIFWQVAGAVTLGTGSHFEGNILAQTNIAMQTGASINGRLLAQTAASLQSNAITRPLP